MVAKCSSSILSPAWMHKLSKLLKLPWCFLSTVFESSLWPLCAIPCLPQNSTHLIIEFKNSLFFFTMSFYEYPNMNNISEDGFPYVEINASIVALVVRWYVVILWLLILHMISFQFLYGFETITSCCCHCLYYTNINLYNMFQNMIKK